MISRQQFLDSLVIEFPKHETVTVPGLGEVLVKKLNAGEQDNFEIGNTEAKAQHFRARMVAATVIDSQGAKLFEEADIPTLSQFPAEVLDPIVEAAMRVNATFSKEYRDSLRKNSNGQGDGSSTV